MLTGLFWIVRLPSIRRELGRNLKVWRYDPPVDIDNDGVPERLVTWQGLGAGNSDARWARRERWVQRRTSE